jgi:hypothetical protein
MNNKHRGTDESGQEFINQLLIMAATGNESHTPAPGGGWRMLNDEPLALNAPSGGSHVRERPLVRPL